MYVEDQRCCFTELSLNVLLSAAGEAVETVLFLAVWLSGPIKWSGVGREGKNNPHKKMGKLFFVVSGTVATSF